MARRKTRKSTVLSYVARYERERGIKASSARQLAFVARKFEQFAGPVAWPEVSDTLVNDWIVEMHDSGLAPITVHSRRRQFLTLWSAAFECRLTETPPMRVRRVRVPEIVPVAFLADELRALLAAADRTKGNVRGLSIPRRLWWRSYLLANYDTALRLADMLSIERDWIWPGGRISVVQDKTSRAHVVQLSRETMQAIDESMAACPARRLIWPMWCNRSCWFRHFNRLVARAGLSGGTSKWIRRSSASYVEAAQPGRGAAHLGHRSSDLARKYYFDPRIVRREATIPPSLLTP